VFLFYILVLVISQVFSAPAQQSHSQPITGSGRELHDIIVELENALYKLKQLSNSLQLPTNKDAAMLGDAEPEFDLSDLDRLSAQQSSSARSRPKPAHSDQSQAVVNSEEELPLEEALQYLMSLAKQRKLQRRDHDIPFPLSDKDNQ